MTKRKEIVGAACAEAMKKNMRGSLEHFTEEKIMKSSQDGFRFRSVDIKQDAVKNITAYMNKHYRELGVKIIRTPGGFNTYEFVMPSFVKKCFDEVKEEMKG